MKGPHPVDAARWARLADRIARAKTDPAWTDALGVAS